MAASFLCAQAVMAGLPLLLEAQLETFSLQVRSSSVLTLWDAGVLSRFAGVTLFVFQIGPQGAGECSSTE